MDQNNSKYGHFSCSEEHRTVEYRTSRNQYTPKISKLEYQTIKQRILGRRTLEHQNIEQCNIRKAIQHESR